MNNDHVTSVIMDPMEPFLEKSESYYGKLRKDLDELERLHSFLTKHTTIDLEVTPTTSRIRIEFTHLEQLRYARQLVKGIYPDWTDKIGLVFESANRGQIITIWACENHQLVELWFECSLNDYPKELLKPGCEFVTEEQSPETRLICSL